MSSVVETSSDMIAAEALRNELALEKKHEDELLREEVAQIKVEMREQIEHELEEKMREEAREEAEDFLQQYASQVQEWTGEMPTLHVRAVRTPSAHRALRCPPYAWVPRR